MIRAPYNFVPLNEKVYFPDWADRISHDIPFSDGESGYIDITLTAESPIFVRNGNCNTDKEETAFSHIDNRPFIPGSSIKGMVRNVLQIISLGKMNQVEKWTPTYRDLSKTHTGEVYKNNMKDVQCGWLRKSEDSESGYEIVSCGKPLRISHKQLDTIFTLYESFYDLFNAESTKKIDFNDNKKKSASFKYSLVEGQNRVYRWKSIPKNNYLQAERAEDGQEGTIVFTGQPGPRKENVQDGQKPSGKRLEFVFLRQDNPNVYKLPKEVYNNFRFAYYDGDKNNESLDWKLWKKRMIGDEDVPVFFQVKGSNIAHFGLSYLYKLPYDYGIEKGIENVSKDHLSDQLDIVECIFGKIQGKNRILGTLKGRVQFSHAFAKSYTKMDSKITAILSSPKPSYYPTYIQGEKGYNDPDVKIKGWKRYPIHRKDPTFNKGLKPSKLTTSFIPLRSAVFECRIRYHNLRKVELGALLSAITLFKCDRARHTLGMGKPLGMGKVKIDIQTVNSQSNSHQEALTIESVESYINHFVDEVKKTEKINIRNQQEIKELLSMAVPQNNQDGKMSELSYMDMEKKEFVEAKKEKLPYYTQLGHEIITISAQTEADFDELLNQTGQNIEEVSKSNKNNSHFRASLEKFLTEKPFQQDLKELYKRHFHNPAVLLKYLQGLDANSKSIKDTLKCLANDIDYKKPDNSTQRVFDYILKVRHNNQVPESFSKEEKLFQYGWEDIKPNQDECLTAILEYNENARIWPPKDSLKEYISNTDWDDKQDLLDLFDS